jgi:simple sugar transport system permease protein
LLFGLLAAAQTIMQANEIPKEITFIIQGVIVVFIAIREGLRIFIRWRLKSQGGEAASKGGGL